jgi:hypothetical protein
MNKEILEVIDYINSAINKTEQFNDYSPEMSNRVLDNRIMTLEGYIRYIERETLPALESLVSQAGEIQNG